jgi:hypothetical protein
MLGAGPQLIAGVRMTEGSRKLVHLVQKYSGNDVLTPLFRYSIVFTRIQYELHQ